MKFINWFIGCIVSTKVFKDTWIVANTEINPDLKLVQKPTINGILPGPKIEVEAESRIEITVLNKLETELSIHWHGLKQKGSNIMDGVPFLTEKPIQPNSKKTYKFSVGDQTGTFWYHAHTGLNSASVFGAFIIKDKLELLQSLQEYDENYQYIEERLIILSDHFHENQNEALKGVINYPFKGIEAPESILINGKGNYTSIRNNIFFKQLSVIKVKPNTKYRLRIIGAQDHSFFHFYIPGHKFTVIEVEGTYVTPFTVDYLDINSGTRYSVILETNNELKNHFIYAQGIDEFDINFGMAILHYEGAGTTLQNSNSPNSVYYATNSIMENKLKPSLWYMKNKNLDREYYPVPRKVDQEIIFSVKFGSKDSLPSFFINNQYYKHHPRNLLEELRTNSNYAMPGVHNIPAGNKTTQIILQQFRNSGTLCQHHPWHFHGHSYYIVDSGPGLYNPKRDGPKIQKNIIRNPPILRDTFSYIPKGVNLNNPPFKNWQTEPEAEGNSCGWYAIRFISDNPGLWMMHCHNILHMHMGLQMVIRTY